jgi:hypothetical protein
MEATETPRTRWPTVLGVIGIIVAVLAFIDEIGELVRLFTWSDADWARLMGAEAVELIKKAGPPLGLVVASAVINLELALLLFVGSILLLRRKRGGVICCKVWAWIVLPWLVIQLVLALTWLRDLLEALLQPDLMPTMGAVVAGVVFGFALVAVFPVFLLVWFARPNIRAEYTLWNIGSPVGV